MYTEFIETGSLAAYARLCGLRLDPHAQLEIREYAAAVSKMLEGLFPVSWKALTADLGSVPVATATGPGLGSVPTGHTPDTSHTLQPSVTPV
jgi:hypothetical protein